MQQQNTAGTQKLLQPGSAGRSTPWFRPAVFWQMSRFLDLKEFGDAARYLRLTNLEHLAAKAQAFDGTLTLPSST